MLKWSKELSSQKFKVVVKFSRKNFLNNIQLKPSQMSNNKTAFKTFIMQNEEKRFSQVFMFPIDYSKSCLDLQGLFSSKIPNYRNCAIRIYDFTLDQYVAVGQVSCINLQIPMEFVVACHSVFLVKYRKLVSQSRSSLSYNTSESERKYKNSEASSQKKIRAKERTISEVIQIVKEWRGLHIKKLGQRKISLQQAANIIGLSKKSLDDYYYQLRLGQKYGFDFKINFDQRIGLLRNFLKSRQPTLKSQESEKHPKSLGIIQQFNQMRINSQCIKIQQEKTFQEPQQFQEQQFAFQKYQDCQEIKLQNQFYVDFYYMESEQDPFINLDPDFRKNKHQNLFYQQLFF